MSKNLSTAKRIAWRGHTYLVYRDSTIFKKGSVRAMCPFCGALDTMELVITWRQYGMWRDVVVQACKCRICSQRVAIRTFEHVPEAIMGDLEVIDQERVGWPVTRDGWLPTEEGWSE